MDCEVTFELAYLNQNGDTVVINSWPEKYDGASQVLDIDLNGLAGSKVRFVLTVRNDSSAYSDANAFWFAPRIVNETP